MKEPPAGPVPRMPDGRPDLSGVWWPGGDVAVTNVPVGESRPPSGPPRQDPNSPALLENLYVPSAVAKAKTLGENERYRRLDSNRLQIDTTVEDLTLLTRPWVVATHVMKLAPFDQIMEVLCTNVRTAALMEAAAETNYGRK